MRALPPLPALVLALVALPCPGAPAQVPPSVQLEGRIESVEVWQEPGGHGRVVTRGRMRVNGVAVELPPATVVTTPVATIAVEDLLGAPLPGRSLPGFLGGTAIVQAELREGRIVASAAAVEPDENLLLGRVTANHSGALWILGVPAAPIADPRLAARLTDEFGFAIDPASVPVDTPAAAEGYFGEDGVFHYHTCEATGTIVGPPNQTSITRADCSAGGDLDLRGASTTPTGTITVLASREGTLQPLGTATIQPDADTPTVGTWKFKAKTAECGFLVVALNSNGSSATAWVE